MPTTIVSLDDEGFIKLDPKQRVQLSGIYKIINELNNKCYIGSAVDFTRRSWQHKSSLRKNIHHSSYLQNAWNKYGEVNFKFEIIEIVEDKSKLIEREQFWIDWSKPEYNLSPAAGTPLGLKRSAETKLKMSNRQKGRKHSIETILKISKAAKGRKYSEETKRKMSNTRKGIKRPYLKIQKWPHEEGNRCKCDECRIKRNIDCKKRYWSKK